MGIKAWFKNLILHHQEPNISELEVRSLALVKEYEDTDADGEWKRHVVFAKLIKEFPNSPKWEIGLSIEVAVNKLR